MGTLQENQSLNAEYERNKKEREMPREIERLEDENERLHNIINKYVEDMENYLESNPPVDMQDYTHRVSDIEYLEKGIEELKFITTIREKLKELKGSDKE
jgi:hypothetical protein